MNVRARDYLILIEPTYRRHSPHVPPTRSHVGPPRSGLLKVQREYQRCLLIKRGLPVTVAVVIRDGGARSTGGLHPPAPPTTWRCRFRSCNINTAVTPRSGPHQKFNAGQNLLTSRAAKGPLHYWVRSAIIPHLSIKRHSWTRPATKRSQSASDGNFDPVSALRKIPDSGRGGHPRSGDRRYGRRRVGCCRSGAASTRPVYA
jgi:hypothetical protein